MKPIDMTGQRYGRLVVLELEKRDDKHAYWNAICDCGKTVVVKRNELCRGKVKSCGCLRVDNTRRMKTTHGLKHLEEYGVWKHIRQRCTNKNDKDFNNYGGRGITVCDRWADFKNFVQDMGTRPTKYHQIDRIDNSKGYGPDNCRWATCKANNRNRRDNVVIEIEGVSKTVPEWAELYGIRPGLIHLRLRRGWPPNRAIESFPGLHINQTVSVRL